MTSLHLYVHCSLIPAQLAEFKNALTASHGHYGFYFAVVLFHGWNILPLQLAPCRWIQMWLLCTPSVRPCLPCRYKACLASSLLFCWLFGQIIGILAVFSVCARDSALFQEHLIVRKMVPPSWPPSCFCSSLTTILPNGRKRSCLSISALFIFLVISSTGM